MPDAETLQPNETLTRLFSIVSGRYIEVVVSSKSKDGIRERQCVLADLGLPKKLIEEGNLEKLMDHKPLMGRLCHLASHISHTRFNENISIQDSPKKDLVWWLEDVRTEKKYLQKKPPAYTEYLNHYWSKKLKFLNASKETKLDASILYLISRGRAKSGVFSQSEVKEFNDSFASLLPKETMKSLDSLLERYLEVPDHEKDVEPFIIAGEWLSLINDELSSDFQLDCMDGHPVEKERKKPGKGKGRGESEGEAGESASGGESGDSSNSEVESSNHDKNTGSGSSEDQEGETKGGSESKGNDEDSDSKGHEANGEDRDGEKKEGERESREDSAEEGEEEDSLSDDEVENQEPGEKPESPSSELKEESAPPSTSGENEADNQKQDKSQSDQQDTGNSSAPEDSSSGGDYDEDDELLDFDAEEAERKFELSNYSQKKAESDNKERMNRSAKRVFPKEQLKVNSRYPDSSDQALTASLLVELRKARWRAPDKIKRKSKIPPGRLSSRAAVTMTAQRSMGIPTTAEPFNQIVRKTVEGPPPVVGMACDLSGSMGQSTKPMSQIIWACARAVPKVGGKFAAVSFHQHVKALVAPGVIPKQVPILNAKGSGHSAYLAISSLAGGLRFFDDMNSVRVLVISSDSMWGQPEISNTLKLLKDLEKKGVRIFWLTFQTEIEPKKIQSKSAQNVPFMQVGTLLEFDKTSDIPKELGKAIAKEVRQA